MSEALRRTFLLEIYPLNSGGDLEIDFKYFAKLIESEEKDNLGRVITPDVFKEKYTEYLHYWKAVYAEKQRQGYLAKDDEKRTIKQYIEYRYYLRSFQLDPRSRDFYLFGGMTDAELRQQIKTFKREIGTVRRHSDDRKNPSPGH